MGLPLAFFLTSTYYGQRLHGDPRGSVDDDHNVRGTPYLLPDPSRHAHSARLMTHPPMTFTPPMRDIASATIVEICSFNRWFLFTHNGRSTHFHVVLCCGGPADPDRVLAQIKARITRLLRDASLITNHSRVWTAKGSTRWINHESGLRGAIAYVNDWQTGENRELLESRKRELQERIRHHREWLRSFGLPEDGKGVICEPATGPRRIADVRYEPGA